MAEYVDGFVIPIPRKNLAAYRRMARLAGKVWMEHGAIGFCESVGEDLNITMGMPFPRQLKVKAGETVVFSWITFKSRAQRDRVNARVWKDPRIIKMMKQPMAFDAKRMVYGGFTTMVKL